jgi:hypothetical protein
MRDGACGQHLGAMALACSDPLTQGLLVPRFRLPTTTTGQACCMNAPSAAGRVLLSTAWGVPSPRSPSPKAHTTGKLWLWPSLCSSPRPRAPNPGPGWQVPHQTPTKLTPWVHTGASSGMVGSQPLSAHCCVRVEGREIRGETRE